MYMVLTGFILIYLSPLRSILFKLKKDVEKKKRNIKRDSCILDLRQVYARK